MKLNIKRFMLPLNHTFKISYDSRDEQESLIVELEEGGLKGYGEATSNPYYDITYEKMRDALENIRDIIEKTELTNPETFWKLLQPRLNHNSFAQSAIDIAANDLFGKSKGMPLYKVWNLNEKDIPITNYTIGIDTIEKMVEKLKERPWPLYKIKLGTKQDVDIIKELRKHTDSTFRVDANGAWTLEEAIQNSYELRPLNVEFIEQPMPANKWDDMKILYKESVLPLIADESCIEEGDVQKCFGHFHGINIKLGKCGGLTPARRMIDKAKKLKMKVMVGCMTESTIGISAIAQLLPLLDYVDMDGALLLKEDIAEGVTIHEGKISYSTENGTGAKLIAT